MPNQSWSWEQMLSILTQSSQHKCTVRLLDTVFCGDGNMEWYYTTKNGVISKKKKEKTKVEDIVQRFCRFASSNPNNTTGKVAVTSTTATGNVMYLTPEELGDFLSQPRSSRSSSWLRVYLRPQGGVDQFFNATYSREKNALDFGVTSSPTGEKTSDISSVANGNFACDQASVFMNDLRRCLEDVTGSSVAQMKVEFVIDDNSHVWLSRVLGLEVGPGPIEDEYINSPDEVSHEASQRSLPGLPPRTTSSQRRRGDSAGGERRDRIIFKEGGTIQSTLGPEDLPGLKAWIMTGMDGTTSDDWYVDLRQYRSNAAPSSELTDLRQSRAQQRRVISPLFASLLERVDGIISGAISVDDEEDFMDKWRALYAQAVASNAVRHSVGGDISACGNCFAICAKLKSLIQVDFCATGAKVHSASDDEEVSAWNHYNISCDNRVYCLVALCAGWKGRSA